MKHIVCPDTIDFDCEPRNTAYVFMAGGITGCPDWQAEYAAKLAKVEGLTMFNPRRPHFDVRDPTLSKKQIEWEHRYLVACDAISFWFPCETLCPITLFELGKCLGQNRHVFVGTHPDYKRRIDVVHQTRLMTAGRVKIHDNLDDLATEVIIWTNRQRKV